MCFEFFFFLNSARPPSTKQLPVSFYYKLWNVPPLPFPVSLSISPLGVVIIKKTFSNLPPKKKAAFSLGWRLKSIFNNFISLPKGRKAFIKCGDWGMKWFRVRNVIFCVCGKFGVGDGDLNLIPRRLVLFKFCSWRTCASNISLIFFLNGVGGLIIILDLHSVLIVIVKVFKWSWHWDEKEFQLWRPQ